jgi:hypothetical protein
MGHSPLPDELRKSVSTKISVCGTEKISRSGIPVTKEEEGKLFKVAGKEI